MASGQWSGSTRRRTLPPTWPKIRARILKRDPVCVLCRMRPSTDCDHINSRDDHSDANLRGTCRPCHSTRSSSQGGKAMAARRQSRFRAPEPHPGMY